MSAMLYPDDVMEFAFEAWHRMGNVKGRLLTFDEIEGKLAAVRAEKRPLFYLDDEGGLIEMPNLQALVNQSTLHPLGYGADSYGIIQYEMLEEAASRLIGTGMVEGIASCLTINHGGKAAISLKLNDDIDIEGYSLLHSYFNLAASHDRTTSFRGTNSINAVVCNNTFQAYVVGVPSVFSIRHTSNAKAYADEAVRLLAEAMERQADAKAAVERLIEQSYTDAEFHALTRQLIGEQPDKNDGKWQTARNGLYARWEGDDVRAIQHTRMAALMAVQGYEQWLKPAKGTTAGVRHLDALHFGKMPLTEMASGLLLAA